MQVQVISKSNGSNNLIKNYLQKIELADSSIVLMDVKVENIEKVEYLNNQALITLKNGEKIIVDNFNVEESSLVFRNEQSEMFLFDFETISYNPINDIKSLLSEGIKSIYAELWPWAAGAVVIGGLAAASGGSGSASSSGNKNQNNKLIESAKFAIEQAIADAEAAFSDPTTDNITAAEDAIEAAEEAIAQVTDAETKVELTADLKEAQDLLTAANEAKNIADANSAIADAITAANTAETTPTTDNITAAEDAIEAAEEAIAQVTDAETKVELTADLKEAQDLLTAANEAKNIADANSALAEAVAAASTALSNPTAENINAAQTAINEATTAIGAVAEANRPVLNTALQTAKDNLEKARAKDSLEQSIVAAEDILTSGIFTEEQQNTIRLEIDSAKSVLDSPESTEQDYKDAEIELTGIIQEMLPQSAEELDISKITLLVVEDNTKLNAQVDSEYQAKVEGKKLIVTDASGDIIAEGTINNGEVTLDSFESPLEDNSLLTYYLASMDGEQLSSTAQFKVPDITAPDAVKSENIIFLDYDHIVGSVDPKEVGGKVSLFNGNDLLAEAEILEDGSFEFELNPESVLTANDNVSFIVTDLSSNKSTQNPTIIVPTFSDQLSLSNDVVSVNILEPKGIELSKVKTIDGSLVTVGVGGLIDLDVIDISKQFVLKLPGTSLTEYNDIDLKLTSYAVLNLELGSTGYVYYRANESQDWQLVDQQVLSLVSLLGIPLVPDSLTIKDPIAGQYMVLVGSTGIKANVAGAMTIETKGVITGTDKSTDLIKGNILINDSLTAGASVDSVKSTVATGIFNAEGYVEIIGKYGVLTIDVNGSYSYQMFENNIQNVGKVDTFTYYVGEQSAQLNIQINSDQYPNIRWNELDPTENGKILDTYSDTEVIDTNGILIEQPGNKVGKSDTNETSVLSISGGNVTSGVINIVEETYLSITLDKSAANDRNVMIEVINNGQVVNLSELTVKINYPVNGNVTENSEANGNLIVTVPGTSSSSSNVNILIEGLVAGSYTVKTTALETNYYTLYQTVDVLEKVIDLDLNNLPKISNNLFDNDLVNKPNITWKIFSTDGEHTFDSSVSSHTLQGLYGDLEINSLGQYTYTLKDKDGLGQKETFDYEVTDSLGISDSSQLIIVIPNNSFVSTPSQDTFEFVTNEVDSLVFNLLAESDVLGGNGKDTVSNFELPSETSNGDVIDVSALLADSATVDNIGQYLSYNADTKTVSIDRDGEAKQYESTELLKVDLGMSSDPIKDLLESGNIII